MPWDDGGGKYPEVYAFADLPVSKNSGDIFLVSTATYLAFPPKLAGFYRDEATGWVRKAPYSAFFLDTKAVYYDNADGSKRMKFELGGITAGTTRTLTVPDVSGTIGLVSGYTAPISVIELRQDFLTAYNTAYKEFVYDGTKVTNIDIWENSSKANKLFSKVLTYTGDNVTEIKTTKETTGQVLTKTLAYSGSQVSNITEAIT